MKTVVVVVSLFVVALCDNQFEEYYNEESSNVSNIGLDPLKQIYFREQRETIMDYSRKLLEHALTVNYKPKFKKMHTTIARHLNSIRRNYPSQKLRNQMLQLYEELPDRAGRHCVPYEEAVVHLHPYAVMMQDRETKIKKLQSIVSDSKNQIKSCDHIGTAETLERGACLATIATNREKEYNTFIIEDLFTNARLDLFALILPLVLDSADSGPFEMLTNAAMLLATKAFACRLNVTITFENFR